MEKPTEQPTATQTELPLEPAQDGKKIMAITDYRAIHDRHGLASECSLKAFMAAAAEVYTTDSIWTVLLRLEQQERLLTLERNSRGDLILNIQQQQVSIVPLSEILNNGN